MPCSLFTPNCFHFQEMTQTSKCSESHWTLFHGIGNAMIYIAIFSHLTLLHENTSFKTSAGRFISVFWRCAALSADQEKVLSFLPKLSYLGMLLNAGIMPLYSAPNSVFFSGWLDQNRVALSDLILNRGFKSQFK